MEELVVSAHEFESFSKWYRYREPVVSGCVQGVSSTRNIHDAYKINIESVDPTKDLSMREVYGLDKRLSE